MVEVYADMPKEIKHDLTSKTDDEIDTWIENHEQRGVRNLPFYRILLEERARRDSRILKVESSINHLMDAARQEKFTTYGDLAAASNVTWDQARHRMNGAGGHLDRLLDVCHARNLPLLTALCVNKQAVETGLLEPHSLDGFANGTRRLGYVISDPLAFLQQTQTQCFKWGRDNQEAPSP